MFIVQKKRKKWKWVRFFSLIGTIGIGTSGLISCAVKTSSYNVKIDDPTGIHYSMAWTNTNSANPDVLVVSQHLVWDWKNPEKFYTEKQLGKKKDIWQSLIDPSKEYNNGLTKLLWDLIEAKDRNFFINLNIKILKKQIYIPQKYTKLKREERIKWIKDHWDNNSVKPLVEENVTNRFNKKLSGGAKTFKVFFSNLYYPKIIGKKNGENITKLVTTDKDFFNKSLEEATKLHE